MIACLSGDVHIRNKNGRWCAITLHIAQDTLFADTAVYEWEAQEQLAITAWYVAKDFSDAFDVGMDAAHQLLKKFPDDAQKIANVEWYEKLKAGLV